MKRSLHPRAVPIEPSLDVVARRALDRRFVAECGFVGPDGIRLSVAVLAGHQLIGLLTPLPADGGPMPGEIVEHQAHAIGHAAVLLADCGVLLAGDSSPTS
jgi:hypothetical protein